ncbi:MAG: thioredoxin family protein [Chloroflexi bacterium]|nr:thioredoxin family protein [Chloroflexota bacterium]
MIPLKDQEAIQAKFAAEMAAPVKIDYFTQRETKLEAPGVVPCAFCKQTQDMLKELSALSDLISLRVHQFEDNPEEKATFGVERVPGMVLRGPGPGFFKYYGIPGGTEFPAFVESLVDLSRWETLLMADSVKALSELKTDVSVRVFVTPTCPYCPQMARAAFMMGIVTEHVKAEVIEVNEFPDLAQRYKVEAVPLTVINDRISIPGALPEPALIEQVVKAAGAKPTKKAPSGPTSEPEKPAEPIERGKRRDSGLYIP